MTWCLGSHRWQNFLFGDVRHSLSYRSYFLRSIAGSIELWQSQLRRVARHYHLKLAFEFIVTREFWRKLNFWLFSLLIPILRWNFNRFLTRFGFHGFWRTFLALQRCRWVLINLHKLYFLLLIIVCSFLFHDDRLLRCLFLISRGRLRNSFQKVIVILVQRNLTIIHQVRGVKLVVKIFSCVVCCGESTRWQTTITYSLLFAVFLMIRL